jgi:hypothetical protein
VNSLAGSRRALLALSVFPAAAGCAGLFLWYWPWRIALAHVLVLALFGSILADLTLNGFRKIPFTCSYLPGKSQLHLMFWLGIVALVVLVDRCAALEERALNDPAAFAVLVLALAAGAVAARQYAIVSAHDCGTEIQFEESPEELVLLGLSRAG